MNKLKPLPFCIDYLTGWALDLKYQIGKCYNYYLLLLNMFYNKTICTYVIVICYNGREAYIFYRAYDGFLIFYYSYHNI